MKAMMKAMTMKATIKTNSWIVLSVTAAAVMMAMPLRLHAEDPQSRPTASAAGARADEGSLYSDGTRAINESRWPDAAGLFQRVTEMHGEHAEGAAYWKAYAENKEGQQANALSTCGTLRKEHPKSKWLDDCGALEIEIRGKSGSPMAPQAAGDETLKLLALNALMQQDQKQAVPILQKILEGNQSETMKSRALVVLAQNPSPEAQAAISQIAHGQSGPELQMKAIRSLAIQGKRADETLADIYQHTSDLRVKRSILQTFQITGDSEKELAAAKTESDPELVRTAVHALGAMGATQDLLTLYQATGSKSAKSDIINSLTVSGKSGAAALATIIQSEQDAELRRRAIRNLGVAGGASVAPALVATYQNNQDLETRRAAAQALFLANDAHDLVTLAKAEKDLELKKYLVQQLSQMHNQEATAYMMEILEK